MTSFKAASSISEISGPGKNLEDSKIRQGPDRSEAEVVFAPEGSGEAVLAMFSGEFEKKRDLRLIQG